MEAQGAEESSLFYLVIPLRKFVRNMQAFKRFLDLPSKLLSG